MSLLDLNIIWGEESHSQWFALILVFPSLLAWGLLRRKFYLKRLGSFDVLQKLIPRRGPMSEYRSLLLLCLALATIILAYMKPQWGEQTRLVETRSLDILLLQDVSQSMLAEDVKPSRLLRSQHEISHFIDHLEGDRVGLMAFGATTRMLCPMTQDYDAIKMFLKELDPRLVMQGTDVAMALQSALSRFKDESIQSKIIVLLSDGEEHDPRAIDIAEEAAKRGVKIYTVGIGSTEPVPIPDPLKRGTWKKDEKGQKVYTRLNESLLKEIADLTQAQYFHASKGGFQLTKILESIRDLERESLGESEVIEYEQRYFIFVILAIVLLLLEWLWPLRSSGGPHEN